MTSGPNQAGGWNLRAVLSPSERHADQIKRSRGGEPLDDGGVRADVDGDAQVFDLSGGRREQGFGLWQGNLGSVLDRSRRGMRSQDQVAGIACHPHGGAPAMMFGKIALLDEGACPLPLDQSRQGRG